MFFRDIPGMTEVKERLINAATRNHVAHAQMFSAKPGSANLPLALAFSTYLNCENPGSDDACGECRSCVKALKYVHPDIHFVFPVSPTKKVKKDDAISRTFLKEWREFLLNDPFASISEWVQFYGGEERKPIIPVAQSREIIKDLSLKTFEGNYKIMIIWLPEMMNRNAANALLKILEEPPEKTFFFLVTNDEGSIISTILSRTQKIAVRSWSEEELVSLFQRNNTLSKDRLTALSNLSAGNYDEMKALISDNENDTHEWFRNWMRLCYKRDYYEIVASMEEYSKFKRVVKQAILQYGLHVMREILVSDAAESVRKVSGDEKEFIVNFSQLFSVETIEKVLELFSDSMYHLDRNANPKIEFTALSLKIADIFQKEKLKSIAHKN